jgi:hypothetical protein
MLKFTGNNQYGDNTHLTARRKALIFAGYEQGIIGQWFRIAKGGKLSILLENKDGLLVAFVKENYTDGLGNMRNRTFSYTFTMLEEKAS